ncbi:MAG: DUF1565 domain-containing protein, partial [Ignavibacteriae bacterium]
MKNIIILIFLSLSQLASSATFYVATNGNDNNSGSIDSPFKTINKAWSRVSAGDIIYVRGGTYTYSMMPSTTLNNKSGTSGNLIKIWNYSGEFPVIDYSAETFTTQKIGIQMTGSNYIHIKGIRVTGIKQPVSGNTSQYGFLLWNNVSNCIFEQIETDHIGGWGVVIGDNCNNNLFSNCDSHHNADPYSTSSPYGGADGFESGSASSTNNTFRGCRAWWNSDDGWDLRIYNGTVTIDNCWSFWNGYRPGTSTPAGNGEGFKLGPKQSPSTTNVLRTVTNCLAFENYATGFSCLNAGYYNFYSVLYNNTAYKNRKGYNYSDAGMVTTLRNNIDYANGTVPSINAANTHNHNTWNGGVSVTDADFVSCSSSGIDGPRQADGSLPVLNFLKLSPTSDLIDAGVNAGLTYNGSAPDLGCFESGSGSTPPPATPVYVSSAIENATPTVIEMTYNLSLANVAPAASAFTVRVNSTTRSVSSVAIISGRVRLTLSGAVVSGDAVTVAYTKPSSNPLQTSA